MTDIVDDYTTWDAPYVLGSLTRAERLEFEEHLEGCSRCRDAVAELAGMPGLLGLIGAETALELGSAPEPESPEAPADLLPRLAAASERQRRRSRWVSAGAALAAAAAAVAIAVPVVTAVTADSDPVSTEQVFAERSMEPLRASPVSADFRLLAEGDRTRIEMTCSYAPGDARYTWEFGLVATGVDGTRWNLGQWPAGPGDVVTLERTVPTTPERIRSVEITSAATGDTVLLGTV
ncbi:anti-sigma factor family protein [Nocardia asteroides]|uniref:anti-sigma factor family protein n=1 Tax=Nocardia asteroides TaxID=1824 RepID=UPI001E5C34FC|nr:zf-HC2 domain-containing protein [Nocardia asteroides]UGT59129.1 zf-HC2 domain-containing protein [Nocardia asteroides]